eukprot:CAMPEP_0172445056 /NCGR_PEP_ID=MMETSP1065-20121228/5027_1 /TAXON_ID=265537 /ORGANISM="Amphiprora paludosa, Strain CCMP125" /LENGTH=691 /DNA_ID=CAMNT_0013195849 /DNA_START=26 /DNA_END=2101 /DNA_ORIENTATION=+
MGKKRNTAKTGDKGLYKGRPNEEQAQPAKGDSDDDAMYNKVDRFHNQREEEEEFLDLNHQGRGGDDDDEDDNEIYQRESVMDLGVGSMSSSDDDDDDNDDEEASDDEQAKVPQPDDSASSSSDSDNDGEEQDDDNVRDWGKKKSVYYHGDTADLEIGQEEDDAYVEEEAAKEVQAARIKEMSEEDFVLSDDDDEDEGKSGDDPKKKETETQPAAATKRRGLTGREQTNYLQQNYAEFLPLVSHFSDVVQDFDKTTNVVVKALYETANGDSPTTMTDNAKAVGATPAGEEYLLSRALIQSSSALNLAMYMLLQSEYAEEQEATKSSDNVMSSHPVLDHLQKLNSMAENMESTVGSPFDLQAQMSNLVKASALLASGNMEEGEDQNSQSEDADSDDDEKNSSNSTKRKRVEEEATLHASATAETANSEEDSDDEEDLPMAKAAAPAKRGDSQDTLMNEARFALRLNEVGGDATSGKKKSDKGRRRRAAPDFGDGNDEQGTEAASRSLASTVNSLEQRFAQSKKAAKGGSASMADQVDAGSDEDDDAVRRGLEMMEAEMGKFDDDEDGDGGSIDPEMEKDEDDNDFYNIIANKSRQQKKARKEHYAVAPKFPSKEMVVDGERAVSRAIIKNRGLVAHKNKLNRNPRVKKREQYRKALIRRKGAVRDIRDPREGLVYGGEETGIKSRVRKSRNLT